MLVVVSSVRRVVEFGTASSRTGREDHTVEFECVRRGWRRDIDYNLKETEVERSARRVEDEKSTGSSARCRVERVSRCRGWYGELTQ